MKKLIVLLMIVLLTACSAPDNEETKKTVYLIKEIKTSIESQDEYYCTFDYYENGNLKEINYLENGWLKINEKYDENGNMTYIVRDSGDYSDEVTYTYDSEDKLIEERRRFGELLYLTEYKYNEMGLCSSRKYEAIEGETYSELITYEYDANGNKTREYQEDMSGRVWSYESEYDENGNLISFTSHSPFFADTTYYYEYNSDGKLTKEYQADGKVVFTYEYDANGNKILENNNNVSLYMWEYDENNNLLYTNETGYIVENTYDENGLLKNKSISYPYDDLKEYNHSFTYEYDEYDNLIKATGYDINGKIMGTNEYSYITILTNNTNVTYSTKELIDVYEEDPYPFISLR